MGDNTTFCFPYGGVSQQDIHDFYNAYLNSNQHAVFLAKQYQLFYDAGVRFPSVYGLQFQWGNANSWGIQGTNNLSEVTGANTSPALLAAQNWNKGYIKLTLGTPV